MPITPSSSATLAAIGRGAFPAILLQIQAAQLNRETSHLARAVRITGHKTRSVFDRYNIVSETDLRDGVDRLAAYVKKKAGKERGPLRPADR